MKNRNHKPDCQCSFCKAKRGELSGKNNPMYGKDCTGNKNSRFINGLIKRHGRLWIWSEGKRRRLSRYVVEQHLGRKLIDTEIIHHINEDCSDDRLENLYLFPSQSEHMRHHGWKNKPILKSNL